MSAPHIPSIESGDPIPHGTLAYLRERTRNQLFELVIAKFIEAQAKGLTKARLARRIHRSRQRINDLLGAPGNWTIDTVSDLLAGIAGEELTPSSSKIVGETTMTEKHQRLMELCNEAIEKAEETCRADASAFGAVNWGDLGCSEVLRCENQDGMVSWRITVEEGHCAKLESFITAYLYEKMPKDGEPIIVETEW